MKVITEIRVHEINGEEVTVVNATEIKIESHERRSDIVIINTGEKSFTVKGSELIAAIKNAQNVS